MKRFTIIKADKGILWFVARSLLWSVICILLGSAAFAKVMCSLDLQLESSKYIAIIICVLSAAIVSFLSCKGLRGNGCLMGAVSVSPIILYSLFNLMFKNNTLPFFAIKVVLILVIGIIVGTVRVRMNKKLKVKL